MEMHHIRTIEHFFHTPVNPTQPHYIHKCILEYLFKAPEQYHSDHCHGHVIDDRLMVERFILFNPSMINGNDELHRSTHVYIIMYVNAISITALWTYDDRNYYFYYVYYLDKMM